ncbi:MAG: hypothetical protein ACOYNC_17590 [Bacteroidales bacterium]
MKTISIFRKILSMALVLAMIVLIIASCRKSDTIYPAVPPVSPLPAAPDAFSDRPLKMLSDYETSHHLAFPGHMIHQLGRGLAGGEVSTAWDVFKGIGTVIESVYNYQQGKQKQNQFQQVQNGLNSIQSQLTNMQTSNVAMISQLGIQIDNLESTLLNCSMNGLISNVNTAMGADNYRELGLFVNIAANWEKDSTNSSNIRLMNNAKDSAMSFANHIYNANDATSMTQTLTGFNTQMTTPLGNVGTGGGPANPLKAYAKTVIDALKVNSVARVLDEKQAKAAYLLVEQYFMSIMNYEFQAATVYVNAANMLDPTGINKLDSIFMASFAKKIFAQVHVFLPVVDFLVVNANEYRDEARFERDMQYEDQGLAPDTVFGPILARAQFMANILCAAVGQPYPVMCGSVITPETYGATAAGPMQFLIGGNSVTTTYDTAIASQLAYTKWVNGTCSPDNSWYINRLGTIGISDPGWSAQTYSISIPSARWSPIQVPSGHVTPQYFNPANLTYSPVKDSVHTMLFGYFAANWQWGEMFIDHWPTNPASGPSNFDFKPFNSKFSPGINNQMYTPFEVYASGVQLNWFMEGKFSNLSSTNRKLGWSGTMAQTKDEYIIVDGNYVDIQTGPNVPPGGTIQAWACYDVAYTMKGSGATFITVNIGTSDVKRTANGMSWYHIGSELTQTQWSGPVNVVNSDFKGPPLLINTAYQMGRQYYYQTQNVTAKTPGTISLSSSYQVVYSGYYNVPI